MIKDLGVFLDSKLDFSTHIDRTISKARATLGVVHRFAKEFGDQAIHKTLYCALVRSHLDYASPVWSPYRQVHIDRIESIQKKFLMSLLGRERLPNSFALPPYTERLATTALDRIVDRHKLANIMVIYDLLMGRMSSLGLRRRIVINDRRGRRSRYLIEERHRTDYGRFEPLNKCIMNFNDVAHIFRQGLSRGGFRAVVLDHLRA